MVAKAQLVEIKWDAKQRKANKVNGKNNVEVQFNPQTLKLSFANETKGGDQPAGGGKQYVGSSTSKLSVELLFDTTEEPQAANVRRKTERVAYFMLAKEQRNKNNKRVPLRHQFRVGQLHLPRHGGFDGGDPGVLLRRGGAAAGHRVAQPVTPGYRIPVR